MKLKAPLLNLVSRCQTICVPECCGVDAYDFSPVHIASFLLMWEGSPNSEQLKELRVQLNSLQADFGSEGAIANGVTIDDMNQVFTGTQIDTLVQEIQANLGVAAQICADAEHARFKTQ